MFTAEKKSHYFISELVAVDGDLFIDTVDCLTNISKTLGHDNWMLPHEFGRLESFPSSIVGSLTDDEVDLLEANGAFRVHKARKNLVLSLGNNGWAFQL